MIDAAFEKESRQVEPREYETEPVAKLLPDRERIYIFIWCPQRWQVKKNKNSNNLSLGK